MTQRAPALDDTPIPWGPKAVATPPSTFGGHGGTPLIPEARRLAEGRTPLIDASGDQEGDQEMEDMDAEMQKEVLSEEDEEEQEFFSCRSSA